MLKGWTSEEVKWIHTELNHHKNCLKPDGCTSLPDLFIVGNEHRNDGDFANLKQRVKEAFPQTKFDYGGGIWAIKDFQVVIWEFKYHITQQGKGTAYNYIAHLSREDKINKYCVVLGDVTERNPC